MQFVRNLFESDRAYREVRKHTHIFNQGGGFVFNSIHNIQGNVPPENVEALFRAVRDSAQAV